jgi:hypothetical protein
MTSVDKRAESERAVEENNNAGISTGASNNYTTPAQTPGEQSNDGANIPKSQAPERPKSESSGHTKTENEETKPKDSKLKTAWKKLELDIGTLMMMFK